MRDDRKRFAKWKAHSVDVRAKHELGEWHPWTGGDRARKLHRLPTTARVLDLLNVGWGIRLKQSPGELEQELVVGFFADVSQALERQPFGSLQVFASGLPRWISLFRTRSRQLVADQVQASQRLMRVV